MTSPRIATLLTTLFLSQIGLAQQVEVTCEDILIPKETDSKQVQSLGSFIPAKPLKRIQSKYPVEEARAGNEGWVKISYVIDAEGNVVDPVVDDHAGSKAFTRSALRAVKRWKFEPAMKDGQSTQICHANVRIDFKLNGNRGTSSKFAKQYKVLNALVDEGEYDEAEKLLEKLASKNNTNRYENALLFGLEARLARKLKDRNRELVNLQRTISTSQTHNTKYKTFNDKYLAFVYERLFLLSANVGALADALDYAYNLKTLKYGETYFANIASSVQQVEALIASKENILVPYTLGKSGKKFHRLVRNQFNFANIQGGLDSVEIRCQRHHEAFTVAESNTWIIPEAWGKCRILVQGQSGASFNLVEMNQA